MAPKRVLAVGCHPDDIEFGMFGTLLLLQEAGCEVHYLNVANGALGTDHLTYQEIVAKRRGEAMESAAKANFIYHESICDDIEVFYTYENVAKLVPVMREVAPEIVLTQHPADYMEDHVNTARLAVTAAFCRGMINLKCSSAAKPTYQDVALYHCMPHSITDQLRRPVEADFYVDIAAQMDAKRAALNCHRSQKEWLDLTQSMDAYLAEMEKRARHAGKCSGVYEFAEGWVQHNPLGFGTESANPLAAVLAPHVKRTPRAL